MYAEASESTRSNSNPAPVISNKCLGVTKDQNYDIQPLTFASEGVLLKPAYLKEEEVNAKELYRMGPSWFLKAFSEEANDFVKC